MNWLAALTIGFLGSFHCVGMCGPIALALPTSGKTTARFLQRTLLYNSGRIVTYAILGSLFGTLGYGLKLAGLQQGLSISLGVIMILTIVFPRLFHSFRTMPGFYTRFVSQLKQGLARFLKRGGATALFGVGLLNGLLPCGLVYLGIAGALSSISFQGGAVFMAFFGLGTLPAMMAVSSVKKFLPRAKFNFFKKAVPYVVVLMGLVFILRGMDLGIPFLSPGISGNHAEVVDCK